MKKTPMGLVETKYVPEEINFVLSQDPGSFPETIGQIDSIEDCQELISKTFVATSIAYTATRYMDVYEKTLVREQYQQELEVNQPELDKRLSEARERMEEAKREFKAIEEQCSASETKVKDMAKQVRIGTTNINLDQSATWQVAVEGKYYYLTYMRGLLQVADVVSIPEHEKSQIFNSQARNEEAVSRLQELIEKAG